MKYISVLAAGGMVAACCVAQFAVAQQRSTFDVASVKLHAQTDGPQAVEMDDKPGSVHYTNVFLRSCILAAYGIKPLQLEGFDGHQPERYDIDAKSETRATGPALMQMLQTLLEDRFKLKYHTGTREMPVYKLTLTKKPHLVSAAGAEVGLEFTGGSPQQLAGRASLEGLANFLSGLVDRPVVDRTGLQGLYDLRIKWDAGQNRQDRQDALIAALESEVGLKLEPGSEVVRTIVIDHYNAVPSAN